MACTDVNYDTAYNKLLNLSKINKTLCIRSVLYLNNYAISTVFYSCLCIYR